MQANFYVYEHWRPDKDVCFYVGKGCLRRHLLTRRPENKHYFRIVDKLSNLGLKVEVKIVGQDLSEKEAFALEISRIAYWLPKGELANKTAGGEGLSGFVHSERTREKISQVQLKRFQKPEERLKLSNACKGRSYGPHSEEHKKKIGDASKGRKFTKETLARKRVVGLKQAEVKRGTPEDSATRKKIAATVKALWSDPDYRERMVASHVGQEPSDEARANMRAGQATRGPRTTEHCARISAAIKKKHADRRLRESTAPDNS